MFDSSSILMCSCTVAFVTKWLSSFCLQDATCMFDPISTICVDLNLTNVLKKKKF
jgi:hypothetical protein